MMTQVQAETQQTVKLKVVVQRQVDGLTETQELKLQQIQLEMQH